MKNVIYNKILFTASFILIILFFCFYQYVRVDKIINNYTLEKFIINNKFSDFIFLKYELSQLNCPSCLRDIQYISDVINKSEKQNYILFLTVKDEKLNNKQKKVWLENYVNKKFNFIDNDTCKDVYNGSILIINKKQNVKYFNIPFRHKEIDEISALLEIKN